MFNVPKSRQCYYGLGYKYAMSRLNNRVLLTLPKSHPEVMVPRYDRRSVTAGIVHVGVGGFHRAHQAVYLDDLLGMGGEAGWGICGVGLRPADAAMRDALVPQDCLYTVVSRGAEGNELRVVGSILRFLYAPGQAEQVLSAMAAPQTKIVTLTITESAYNYNEATGEFNADHPDVRHDLQDPTHPVGVFGYLAEALHRRRRSGLPAFTVLSCDNVPHNGDVARRSLLAFAGLRDPTLSDWIAQNAEFPNAMVDRITPQTTEADREMVLGGFGIEDAWPVVTEPFRQWIIEDRFSDGRPLLEGVGVQFVSNVTPYEKMKLRLLNGSHSAMGYLGFLAGFTYIHEIMEDPLFAGFVRRLMDDEVTPLLPPVPGIDLVAYKDTLMSRFANPAMGDQVTRICLDGSSKMPKCLLPSLREALAAGRPSPLLTLAVAGWFRYLLGEDELGRPYPIDDPRSEELTAKARTGRTDPRPLLAVTDLFGDLGASEAFTQALAADLGRLYADGARATLTRVLF